MILRHNMKPTKYKYSNHNTVTLVYIQVKIDTGLDSNTPPQTGNKPKAVVNFFTFWWDSGLVNISAVICSVEQ